MVMVAPKRSGFEELSICHQGQKIAKTGPTQYNPNEAGKS
jgi:hypothetical protein